MVSNKKNWRYRGVLHEFLECPGDPDTPILPLAMRRGEDGARHHDATADARDIAVLEQALAVEKDPSLIARYTMALGGTYDAATDYRRALDCHLRSADLCRWDEEVYFSLLMAAVNAERVEKPEETVLHLYDRAILVRPARAEARHGASRYCRSKDRFPEGFRYAEAGLALTLPREGISLNPWVYEYGMLEEYSINAYHIGQYNVCLQACLEILKKSKIPNDVLTRSCVLARRALAKMIDPVWGCRQSAYSSTFAPAWQF